MQWLSYGDLATTPGNPYHMIVGLLLAFLCGHALAWTYMTTHSGLSYSRGFVNSLLVMPVVVSLVMMVLSNNLVTAFGLMAVFAIVRFRNILRDTLDTTYVLSVIVVGMACGTYKYSTAVSGCLVVIGIMFYVWGTSFGVRHRFDVALSLRWSRPLSQLQHLEQCLNRHSLRADCISNRGIAESQEAKLSFRLLLRNPNRLTELLAELDSYEGVSEVIALRAEDESEV